MYYVALDFSVQERIEMFRIQTFCLYNICVVFDGPNSVVSNTGMTLSLME